jgi:predicted PurR-regulated permease PerM
MEETYFKRILSVAVLIVLLVLSFFLLKPVLISIIFGAILAFVFLPVYEWMNKGIKSKNISAAILCIFLIALIILPMWFLTPIAIDQSFKLYQTSQQLDFIKPLQKIFPSLFSSQEFSSEIGSAIHSFVTRATNSLVNTLGDLILNFPRIFLQLLVVFFTFFYVLRDKDELVSYLRSLSPFSKDVENKFFELSRGITASIIYGHFIVGIAQGIIAGLGFLIFNVQSALLLTILAAIAGILPIIGTSIIWIPVVIYLVIAGNTFAAFGVGIFGIISSLIDTPMRTMIVSKRTKIHSSVLIIGMIGGLFLFGFVGFILGPLILAYLLILLDLYRKRNVPGIFLQTSNR